MSDFDRISDFGGKSDFDLTSAVSLGNKSQGRQSQSMHRHIWKYFRLANSSKHVGAGSVSSETLSHVSCLPGFITFAPAYHLGILALESQGYETKYTVLISGCKLNRADKCSKGQIAQVVVSSDVFRVRTSSFCSC